MGVNIVSDDKKPLKCNCKNIETIYGHSKCSMVYLKYRGWTRLLLPEIYTGWLRRCSYDWIYWLYIKNKFEFNKKEMNQFCDQNDQKIIFFMKITKSISKFNINLIVN